MHPVLEGVVALTDRRQQDRVYELTGPRLLNFAQAAAELSAAIGRTVQYVPLSLDAFRAETTPSVGPDLANIFTDLCEEVFDGRNACLTTGVQEALGRAPCDFADYCKATAATGIWTPVPVTA